MYYKVKTPQDIIPSYADYIKLQIRDSYVASPLSTADEKKEQKAPNPVLVSPFNNFLKRFVLKLLNDKPLSGSEIINQIWIKTDKSWKPTAGLIYRLLAWLKRSECTSEEPGKRYILTEKGVELLNEPVSNNRKFVEEKFLRGNREKMILDCACGGGAEIDAIKEMGFKNVFGLEMNGAFIKTASKVASGVVKADMHSLTFKDNSFDIVFSAHTIEHAYYLSKLLQEFWRVLKSDGALFVILPYPDSGHEDDFHVAKYELGTNILDQGESVLRFFAANGFLSTIVENSKGMVQEPLLWAQFRKKLFERGKPYRPY